MTRAFLFLLFTSVSIAATAQDYAYGFKAGLNFNRIRGDAETDDAGNEIESFSGNSGFHVGATFSWKATELMGVRGEFLFSQKGGRRKFEGQSYYIFDAGDDKRIFATGTRDMSLNITQSYIDIPVMGYFKPVSWLEIYAGGNVGFLVASSAFGDLKFSGVAQNGAVVSEIRHELDFSYHGDDPGEAEFAEPPASLTIGTEQVILPQKGGAYFEFSEDRGTLYKVIDAGVLGGISAFLSSSLYVSFRANIGLTDVTKSKADVSLAKLDENNQFISRNDKDTNYSLQASVGFSF